MKTFLLNTINLKISKLIVFMCFWFFVGNNNAQPFITTWKTDNPGPSCNSCITIPTTGVGYNYDVDWNNDGTFDQFGITGDVTHDFGTAGTYTIRIQGAFPRIYFNNSGDRQKILSIDQWGSIVWVSMERAFYGCRNMTYNANDIPNLSTVTNMSKMFYQADYVDGDLNSWDVSNITNMSYLFSWCLFDGEIINWDVANVTNMSYMFYSNPSFNRDISNWNVSSVARMDGMFYKAFKFNYNLNNWDVSSVTNMGLMFKNSNSFNGNISNWDVSKVTNMEDMFEFARDFQGDLSNWDVSNVTRMEGMFQSTNFNYDLSNWDVSSVTNMSKMFQYSRFNGDISAWDVSNVQNMSRMFNVCSFAGSLNSWDVSNVTRMDLMFSSTSFNGDISCWDVSNVTRMDDMFSFASYNNDLSSWNVSRVSNMENMFFSASSFDQNLGTWDLSSINEISSMLDNSGMSVTNYDNTLIGWESQGVTNLTLGANGLDYCNGEVARTSLINTYGWTITGDNYDCSVLPVEFLRFDAISVNNTIVLTWSTTSETNNDGFVIERSKDGLDWATIGFVEGRGSINERKDYEYIDRQPLIGNNYYRLKQIDYDGNFEFSPVRNVLINNKDVPNFLIYPNPSSGIFNLTINNPQRKKANIRILDMTGTLHWSSQFSHGEIPTSWTQEIDISKSGVYIVVSQIGSEVITEKVMVVSDY